MNLEQWHKVNSGSNNSSRVTLRFMADKDIPIYIGKKWLTMERF